MVYTEEEMEKIISIAQETVAECGKKYKGTKGPTAITQTSGCVREEVPKRVREAGLKPEYRYVGAEE